MYSDYNNSTLADPELYLIHLNRIDYKTSFDKYKMEKSYKWNPYDAKRSHGWQHRLKNDDAFDEYYLKIKNSVGKVEPIPKWIKDGVELLR